MSDTDELAARASEWWAERLELSDKRTAFAEALRSRLRTDLARAGKASLGVDYDPSEGALLDSVRAVGIACRGTGFSAKGVFSVEKTAMNIRDGAIRVKEGYGAPWCTLRPPAPPEAEGRPWTWINQQGLDAFKAEGLATDNGDGTWKVPGAGRVAVWKP